MVVHNQLTIADFESMWDVLTTVVWNIEAVAEFHFITLRDLPFVRNFVNYEMLFLPNDESS